jgi:hypothetical protein
MHEYTVSGLEACHSPDLKHVISVAIPYMDDRGVLADQTGNGAAHFCHVVMEYDIIWVHTRLPLARGKRAPSAPPYIVSCPPQAQWVPCPTR